MQEGIRRGEFSREAGLHQENIFAMAKAEIDNTFRTVKDRIANLRQWEIDTAVEKAVEKAMGRTVGEAALPGAIGGLAISLEPITGALIGAGISSAALKAGLPRLLSDPQRADKLVRWALNLDPTKEKKGEIAASFAALAAEGAVLPKRREPEREAEPAAAPERRSTKPFQDRVPPQRPQRHGRRPTPPRDAQGRWVGRGAIDHSGLEEMFEGAFAG
jgi:hypothetical protein